MLRRFVFSVAPLVAVACGGGAGSKNDAGDAGTGGSKNGSGTGGGFDVDPGAGGEAGDGNGPGGVCEVVSSESELLPVYLAFVFDVSGSMGKLDQPNYWHDPTKKWLPVTEATRSFFEGSDSTGLLASLSLFPKKSDKCAAESYETPEVEFTALPAPDFGAVLDDYEAEIGSPLAGGDWRGGTPTLAAFEGTLVALEAQRAAVPAARYAIVLVTDGLPQGCDNDSLDDVAAAVGAAKDDGIPTYVIGVKNPTEPPSELPEGWDEWGCGSGGDTPCAPAENLEALGAVAVAGGTGQAFLIDTDDPSAAKTAFLGAIAEIRGKSASCELSIGKSSVDPDFISPTLRLGGKEVSVAYDPSCNSDSAWHFDDPDAPKTIVLCDATCADLSAEPDAEFEINFLCERRVDVR